MRTTSYLLVIKHFIVIKRARMCGGIHTALFHALPGSGLRVTFRPSVESSVRNPKRRKAVRHARAVFLSSNDLIMDHLVSRLWIADWQSLVRCDRLDAARASPFRCRCKCELGLMTSTAKARFTPRNYGARCCIHLRVILITRPSRCLSANRHNLFCVFAFNRC